MRTPLLTPVLVLCLPLAVTSIGSEPTELARGVAPQHPRQPQVAIDSKGAVHVVFGVENVVSYRRSDDGGEHFSDPVELPSIQSMSLGMRRGPRIAAMDSVLCVTAIGGKQGKGRDGDVLALRSTDGGKKWVGPTPVNDVAGSAREGLHGMAAGPGGELCCVWLDLRNSKTEVMASTSTDGGNTWGKNVLVYKSPDGSVCECCHPSIAFDPQGGIHVLWRNSLAGARDMYAASSTDLGRTFGSAVKLGRGSWPLKACPMDGGGIAAISAGKIATAWRRGKEVFLSVDGQTDERLLGPGEQPWITATAVGPVVVWLKKRGEVAYLLTPGSNAPVELATDANDPVIASSATGTGPLVAVWESQKGKDYTVQCQVIANPW